MLDEHPRLARSIHPKASAFLPAPSARKMHESIVKERLARSIQGVVGWVQSHDYKAYDPGDGELSFLRCFTLNIHFLRRLLTAAVLRSPFHIRPWIGIRPHRSTKAMGYIAWGSLKLYALEGAENDRSRAEACLKWLMENRSPGYAHYSWGNDFAFSTRSGTIPRHEPTIVWSSLIGLAFLEAYEVLADPRYLQVAASTAEWIKQLPREQTSRGTCLSYVAFKQSSIHNSNMLGAALLARVAAHTGDNQARELAREAMVYSCARQNPDGSWFYGEAPMYHWMDNFHTGYNLDSLKRFVESTGDTDFEENLRRGLRYFKLHFFEADGRPRYYHNKTYPTDIQCAAQAIDTLAFFSDRDDVTLPIALKVAKWTLDHMQAPDGHFHYRDLGWTKVKTPMLHWGQGTMFKALAHLLTVIEARETSGQFISAKSTDGQPERAVL
jgi:rhamnogalacturonyl hydrolase YesR